MNKNLNDKSFLRRWNESKFSLQTQILQISAV